MVCRTHLVAVSVTLTGGVMLCHLVGHKLQENKQMLQEKQNSSFNTKEHKSSMNKHTNVTTQESKKIAKHIHVETKTKCIRFR